MISLNYDDEVMIATDNVQDEASQLDVEIQKDEESLEFSLSTELKAKLAAPLKQSIIIKLVRKSLGYKNFLLVLFVFGDPQVIFILLILAMVFI